MKILDLYCGAGGAAEGYHRVWPDAEIVGVDIKRQKRYPFTFIQADAAEFWDSGQGAGYDLYPASPPCQAWTRANRIHKKEYPMLIDPTREWFQSTGKPYVIENVEGAPLDNPVMLCGTFFDLKVYRHRLFETWPMILMSPQHVPHNDKQPWRASQGPSEKGFVTVYGNGGGRGWQEFGIGYADYARLAMGIPWMSKRELAEAIPPAYTKWIGEQLSQHVGVQPC